MSDTNLPTIDDVMLGTTLPSMSDVGDNERDWKIPVASSDETRDDVTLIIEFHGQFIGMGSTQRVTHTSHMNDYADPGRGERCNACRWFELRLFYDEDTDQYIMHFAGRSSVPEESQRFRMETAVTAYEVLEVLSSQRVGGTSKENYLPDASRRALAQAAQFDKEIEQAYVARRATL